jgi:large subunit ribosomal protein L15
MKYGDLQVASHKNPRRVGRGISAGQGKTAGRGTKGQNARAGSSKKPGFEGGQNPLIQRLPKLRGFTSHRPLTELVYTGQLETLKKAAIDNQVLFEAGILASQYSSAKLVVNGTLTKKVAVKLQSASASAVKAVEKAGGSFTKVDQVGRPQTSAGPKSAKRDDNNDNNDQKT